MKKPPEPRQGPELELLTRRLAECPLEFLAEPAMRSSSHEGNALAVRVDAVVADLVLDLGGSLPASEALQPFDGSAGAGSPHERNRLRLTLVAAWLLHHQWFRDQTRFAGAALHWLARGLADLAGLAAADLFVTDFERREELARLCLQGLNLLPAGETPHQAQDRLAAISSVERSRVVAAAREREEAARRMREAMRKKQAAAAAARAFHE